MVKRIRSRIQDVGFGTALWLLLFLLVPDARLLTPVFCQQPQAQSGQPIYSVNAKYVQGVGTGYWPTAGSGLTLNIAAGTVMCDQVATNYVGGTLTMAASQTNYVYLDQSNSCAPATNTTGFTDVHMPIASVTTNASSIIAVTDLRTWFNGGKNVVYNAARFPGADAEAKIAACHAALPSTGGTCDAREFQGAQTWGATLIISKPVHLVFGHATFTYAGIGDMIFIPPTAIGPIIIEGQGPTDSASGTALINNNPSGNGINSQMPFGSGRLTLYRLRITSAVTVANRVSGNAINVDFGDDFTSVAVTIEDVEAFSHVFGIRVVQPIQLQIKGGRASGFLDGYRIEGGTSSGLDSTYGQGASRHNYCLTVEYHGFPIWRASRVFLLGQFIVPKVNTTGHIYKCTTAGTTAATEPTFPTGSGATVSDGSVVWTEFGLATQPGVNQAGVLQRWQASTAYSLNQVVSPFQYNNSDFNVQPSTTHLYKCTTAGTSAATEPLQTATIVAATGLARSGNVTTATATAVLPSNFYVGNTVTITGAGDTSFNGSWTITSVPMTTTFKFTNVAANLTVGSGTATVPGWTVTSGGTVTDGTVTWTEIGSARTAAFGPTYTTLKNTASDTAQVSAYKFEGASVSVFNPGAEGIGGVSNIIPVAYWMLNSGVIITNPETNIGPGTIDMFRVQGSALQTGGGAAVAIIGASLQGNGNGFGLNDVNNSNVSTLISPSFIAGGNSPVNDPSGKLVMLGGNGTLQTTQLSLPIILGARGVIDTPTLPSGLTAFYATDTVGNAGPMLQLDRLSGSASTTPFIVLSTSGNTTTIGSLEQSGAASGALAVRSGTTATPATLSFFGTAVVFPTVTFSTLPASPTNGMVCYCSDCTIANPCAGGGTGAIAKRLNGVWVCN